MPQEDQSPRVQSETATAAEREALRRRELLRHVEAQRGTPTPATDAAPSARVPWTTVAAVVIAIAVGAAALSYYGRDHVSDADKASWAAAWAAAPPQVAHALPPPEVPAALAAMGLTPPQRAALQAAIDDGRTRLVYLTFTDVVEEDGDRVRVESEGVSTEITIMHRTTKVVFPEPASGIVNVTGLVDGGGGITIAITSGATPVNLPYMDVGQVVGIPVVVAP